MSTPNKTINELERKLSYGEIDVRFIKLRGDLLVVAEDVAKAMDYLSVTDLMKYADFPARRKVQSKLPGNKYMHARWCLTADGLESVLKKARELRQVRIDKMEDGAEWLEENALPVLRGNASSESTTPESSENGEAETISVNGSIRVSGDGGPVLGGETGGDTKIPQVFDLQFMGNDITHARTGEDVYVLVPHLLEATGLSDVVLVYVEDEHFAYGDELQLGDTPLSDDKLNALWVNQKAFSDWKAQIEERNWSRWTPDDAGSNEERGLRFFEKYPEHYENVEKKVLRWAENGAGESQPENGTHSTNGSVAENGQPERQDENNSPVADRLSGAFTDWSDQELRTEIKQLVDRNLNNWGRLYSRMEFQYGISPEELADERDTSSNIRALNRDELLVMAYEADKLLR